MTHLTSIFKAVVTQLPAISRRIADDTMANTSPMLGDAPQPLSKTTTVDTNDNRDGQGPQKYSCVLCKERKIKCDRHDPCAACVKAHVPCVFKKPEPPKRRKRGGDEVSFMIAMSSKDDALLMCLLDGRR